jgi:F-type H+-transporting ATPase subunit delta
LRTRLAAYVGKEIRLQVRVDQGLKGGVVARVGDLVLDGSMATQLERLHKRLAGD